MYVDMLSHYTPTKYDLSSVEGGEAKVTIVLYLYHNGAHTFQTITNEEHRIKSINITTSQKGGLMLAIAQGTRLSDETVWQGGAIPFSVR